jgi:hypothetical protein
MDNLSGGLVELEQFSFEFLECEGDLWLGENLHFYLRDWFLLCELCIYVLVGGLQFGLLLLMLLLLEFVDDFILPNFVFIFIDNIIIFLYLIRISIIIRRKSLIRFLLEIRTLELIHSSTISLMRLLDLHMNSLFPIHIRIHQYAFFQSILGCWIGNASSCYL